MRISRIERRPVTSMIGGGSASYPVFAEEAATLAEVQGQIAIVFRALGGEAGVLVAGAKSRKSGHRLRWRQHIGLGDESIDHPGHDGATSSCRTGSPCFRIASSTPCSIAGWRRGSPRRRLPRPTRSTRCGAIS